MKFLSLLTTFVAAVVAADNADQFQEDGSEIIDLVFDYEVKGFPNALAQQILPFFNENGYFLKYDLENNDDRDINIIGVGGVLLDPMTGDVKVNLTSGSVGPQVMTKGDNFTFNQHIPLNVAPNHYVLSPQLFIVVDGDIKMVPARPQMVVVEDAPISFFNPKLILLELVLLVTMGGLAYVIYDLWGRAYLYGGVVNKKQAKQQAKANVAAKASGAKSYNDEWLPDTHVKKTKSKKAH